MTTAADLLRSSDTLLLDFDGPICAVFAGITNREAAQRLFANLDHAVPAHIAATDDPFDVLQFAATLSRDQADTTDRQFRQIEVEAVESARPTPGASALIRASAGAGRSIGIVSNNSSAAVRKYLARHGLLEAVSSVCGRESGDTTLLKPNPHLLLKALSSLGSDPEQTVFVGDSVSDVVAAHKANVACIAFANRPEKVAVLRRQDPSGIVTALAELL